MRIDAPETLSCIAVDDEPIGLSIVRAHAAKTPFLNLLETFVSATEALAYVQTQPVDLIFLDIQMPDLSGLEMARLIGPSVHVIFTTAHPHYAIDGFDLAAVDYLLKPIGLNRFWQACSRVADKMALLRQPTELSTADHLFVKTGYDWARINLASLLYVEADDNYATFCEPDKRTLTRMTLSDVMDKLPPEAFVRIHKSYVVALAKIDKVERHQVHVSGHILPLSAHFRDTLLQYVSR